MKNLKIFKEIKEVEDIVLKLGLGDFGIRLKLFVESIDLDNPLVFDLFEGFFKDSNYFSEYCSDLFKVVKFVKDNKLETILPVISNSFNQEEFLSKVKIPKNPKLYVRFLKNKSLREEIRSLKKKQDIDLYFLKSDFDFWQMQPESFDSFIRFDLSYKKEIEKIRRIIETYKQIDCSLFANEGQSLIDAIEAENILYFGFHKLNITKAVVVLAKTLGCNYSNGLIAKEFFCNKKNVAYTPRIYPLKYFWEMASDYLKTNIKHLEEYPEIKNKPIFDHFALIVPSFNLLESDNDIFYFQDLNGFNSSYYNEEEGLTNLDLFLVKNKLVNPILIAEKDSHFYFLDYFYNYEHNKHF